LGGIPIARIRQNSTTPYRFCDWDYNGSVWKKAGAAAMKAIHFRAGFPAAMAVKYRQAIPPASVEASQRQIGVASAA
jgi:hypothetical protein